MSLSDTAIKNAKPKDKPYKLTDEKGMFLLINPNGSKYFRMDYRFDGKRKTLALGIYPEISLKQARDKRDDARQQAALRRMGFSKDEVSIHGFRATARTLLDEVLGFRPDFIEHQLAHAVRDPNGLAYNRTAHLEERRKMMQAWANYLENSKLVGVVLPFERVA